MINNLNNNAYFNLKSQELARQHRNKTSSQQKQVNKTLEGVVVNNFIKEDGQNVNVGQIAQNPEQNTYNMDDICNALVISSTPLKSASIGARIIDGNSKKKDSSLLLSAVPLAASATALIGGGLGLTSVFHKSAQALNNKNILKAERLPILAMNMNIRQEPEFAAYMALRNPNKKTILAMLGVFLMSGATLIGKSLVDGVKDIWVKKKEADANKDLQESLIEIETKTFAGKLDVVRDELSSKAKYFNDVLISKQNSASAENMFVGSPFLRFFGFRGKISRNEAENSPRNDESKSKTEDKKFDFKNFKNSPLTLVGLTVSTLALGIFMGKKMFKNVAATDNEIRKFVQNGTDEINVQIEKLVQNLSGMQNKENDTFPTDFARLKKLLQIKRADSLEVQTVLKKISFLSEDDMNQNVLDIMTGIKSIYGDAPETLGGKIGQIQYYCYLDENRGHLYNWIMNPENPFAGHLFLAFTTISAAGYLIKKAIEGVKEAAVIRENTNTEKDLQERLIDVEIRNFKSKKQSAVAPLMDEFNLKAASGAANAELKTMADNILLEIKNGPPFVYA